MAVWQRGQKAFYHRSDVCLWRTIYRGGAIAAPNFIKLWNIERAGQVFSNSISRHHGSYRRAGSIFFTAVGRYIAQPNLSATDIHLFFQKIWKKK